MNILIRRDCFSGCISRARDKMETAIFLMKLTKSKYILSKIISKNKTKMTAQQVDKRHLKLGIASLAILALVIGLYPSDLPPTRTSAALEPAQAVPPMPTVPILI